MKAKLFDIELKAIGDADGTFTAYASVFDNVDSYGDMVIKGAFEESLAEWAESGAPIPAFYVHQMRGSAFMNVGHVLEASEDDHGLLVKVQLDIEDNAEAKYIYKLLKEKRLRQMSFAYDTLEAGWVTKKEDGIDVSYYELRKLKIHEISIVPVGANQETEVLAVKAAMDAVVADVKTGRGLSADSRADLMSVAKALVGVLDQEVQVEADGTSDAKAEEPAGAKAEEPTNVAHARALAANQLTQTLTV